MRFLYVSIRWNIKESQSNRVNGSWTQRDCWEPYEGNAYRQSNWTALTTIKGIQVGDRFRNYSGVIPKSKINGKCTWQILFGTQVHVIQAYYVYAQLVPPLTRWYSISKHREHERKLKEVKICFHDFRMVETIQEWFNYYGPNRNEIKSKDQIVNLIVVD